MKIPTCGLPRPRLHLHHPSTQNVIAGVGIGFSAGVFVSLNLLGAGGGRPEAAHVIQIANAILSSVWFFSACLGGTYLSLLGPGLTMSLGIGTYALYVGSLWYYDAVGVPAFPLAAGAVIGAGAGAVFITSGYIQVAYADERSKGRFIAVQNNLQALASIACSLLPLILNRGNDARAGVPPAVYATFVALMAGVALLALCTLRRPDALRRADGSVVARHARRSLGAELRANLSVFTEWRLLVMLPAFLPAGAFLVYLGSANAFANTLRARSLLSFLALVVQVPAGHLLHLILDHPRWARRTRALAGLACVGAPLVAAWVWEIARTRAFDRNQPPTHSLDWNEPAFAPAAVLFVLNWTASVLWQYLVPWFVGALTNAPARLSHYMGVQRGFLAAGEAICFGADAAGIPYPAFAGAILALYVAGMAALACLAVYHVTETNYGCEGEEGAVAPKYALNGREGNEDEKIVWPEKAPVVRDGEGTTQTSSYSKPTPRN